jgi:hypothetical protein
MLKMAFLNPLVASNKVQTQHSALKLSSPTHIPLILNTIRILKASQLNAPHVSLPTCSDIIKIILILLIAFPITITNPPKSQHSTIFQPRTLWTLLDIGSHTRFTTRSCASFGFTFTLWFLVLLFSHGTVFPLTQLEALVRIIDIDWAAKLDV